MKSPLTPSGIEPATFRFVAQHLNPTKTLLVAVNTLHKMFTLRKKELQETGFQYAATHSFDNRASLEHRVVIYIQKYFDKHNKEWQHHT
jgi:hypothetical protein